MLNLESFSLGVEAVAWYSVFPNYEKGDPFGNSVLGIKECAQHLLRLRPLSLEI